MEKNVILQEAIKELKVLAKTVGKNLSEKALKNLFLRKKAYQKDWPKQILRKKATLIAGATVMAVGEPTEKELLEHL